MRILSGRVLAAAVGFLATAATGSAIAADLDESAPPQYSTPEPYQREMQIEEGYVYREPPPVYGYLAPPPIVYYRPRVVVAPPPYYVPHSGYRAYAYAYRRPAYVVRRPGPYVAGGAGPYRWSRRGVDRW